MGGQEEEKALPSRQSSLTSCWVEPTLALGLGVRGKLETHREKKDERGL